MESGNIKVFARVRPLNEKEQQGGEGTTCIDQLTQDRYSSITIQYQAQGDLWHIVSKPNQLYIRPSVLLGQHSIAGVSERRQGSLVKVQTVPTDSVFQGINGTVFAYGQTSSGKTYTCMGPDIDDAQQKGLIPRLVESIFSRIAQSPDHIEFRLKLSFIEIYMEKLRDLIDVNRTDLKIRQSKTRGIYIQNCSQAYVSSPKEVFNYIKIATGNRSLGHTNMNEASSRSHMVFFFTVYQNNLQDLSAKSAKLTLIDLAGSEKVGKTGAEGKLLDEAKQINKSLSSLGNVINALTEAKIGHVPYRDSKLTRILQESLGGNAKTSLIINLSPSILNDAETLSTLRFGYRAKNIKNKPKVNRQYTVAELLLLLEKAELKIKDLQRMIKDGVGTLEPGSIRKSIAYLKKQQQSDDEDSTPHRRQQRQPMRTAQIEIGSDDFLSPSRPETSAYEIQTFDPERDLRGMETQTSRIYSQSEPSTEVLVQTLELGQNEVAVQTIEPYIDFVDNPKLQEIRDQYEKRITELEEEADDINAQKTSLTRQFDLTLEKFESLKQEHGFFQSKISLLEKENQVFLEKQVGFEMECSDLRQKLHEADEKLAAYREHEAFMQQETESLAPGLKELGLKVKLPKKVVQSDVSSRVSNLFGLPSSAVMLENQDVESLKHCISQMQQQLTLYRHMEEQKNRLMQQRNQFEQEKTKLFRDLENRVQKVVTLEELLDEEKQKYQCLLRNVNLDEKSKTRRIVNLEAYINELSTHYYVLKNQQSAWRTDNKIAENKLRRKNERIGELERELSTAKQQLYLQRLKHEELQEKNQQLSRRNSSIEFPLPAEVPRNNYSSNIVKVLRPSINYRGMESDS